MSNKNRKIGFYSFTLKDNNNQKLSSNDLKTSIRNVLNLQRNDESRQLNILKTKKFHVLDTVEIINEQTLFLIFKTAKYNHCPPLLDINTLQERVSDKTPEEGESEKTHALIRFYEDEAIMLLEERQTGIAIGAVRNIFKQLIARAHELNLIEHICDVDYTFISRNDIFNELNNMTRVKICEMHLDKQLLGSSQLNFSNNTEQINQNIVLNVKAEKKKNIIDYVRDIFNNFISSDTRIKRIRIQGVSENNTKVLIDTRYFKKIENIEAELEELTRVVDSNSIKNSMINILNNFNQNEE